MLGREIIDFIESNALRNYDWYIYSMYIRTKVLVNLKTRWDYIEYTIWKDGSIKITKHGFGKTEEITKEEALKLRGLA
jgi:hypothetical protein